MTDQKITLTKERMIYIAERMKEIAKDEECESFTLSISNDHLHILKKAVRTESTSIKA